MFGWKKKHSNKNWAVTIRRGDRHIIYLNKLLYEAWGRPKRAWSEYDSKNKDIILIADNIRGTDIHPVECGYWYIARMFDDF